MSRIIVISNRVSAFGKGENDTGGMAVGIKEMLSQTGGIWFGWSGKISKTDQPPAMQQHGNITLITIDLTKKQVEHYYSGYSNQVLWPLFHYRLDFMEYSREFETSYHEVNERFAAQIAQFLQPDDIVWIHDYHLIPLAAKLRRRHITNMIGFFLHIPFPPAHLLICLPGHRRLFESLNSYNLLGFQTENDLARFHQYLTGQGLGTVLKTGWISLLGKTLRAQSFSVGIDVDDFTLSAAKAMNQKPVQEFKENLGSRQLIIGVDRLDYSKGLIRRVKAYEDFLQAYPASHGKHQILQVTPPTRSGVPMYHFTAKSLEKHIIQINGKFADLDWTPIRYVKKSYGRKTLAAIYRLAAVGVVTPLRDGMNLIAKEYIAAQNPDNPGVLILSRFAGAAVELEDALLVNPYDSGEVGESIHTALTMPLDERKERHHAMMIRLRAYTIHDWHHDFIATLKKSVSFEILPVLKPPQKRNKLLPIPS